MTRTPAGRKGRKTGGQRAACVLACVVLLGLLPGCSYVLDIFANPDAPMFKLVVQSDGVQDRLEWDPSGLSRTQPADTDSQGRDRSWEMLFGYYVFVSTNTPYDGYRLAARILNDDIVTRTWVNRFWNSTSGKWYETQSGFEPSDALGYVGLANTWTLPVSGASRFYRVAVIALKRSVDEVRNDKDERVGDQISYRLAEMGVSGWGAP